MPERAPKKRKRRRDNETDGLVELREPRKRKQGRRAAYGDATPEDVAKAILGYRPKD